eukprot:4694680-Pyramimonas_sp.AAC.2
MFEQFADRTATVPSQMEIPTSGASPASDKQLTDTAYASAAPAKGPELFATMLREPGKNSRRKAGNPWRVWRLWCQHSKGQRNRPGTICLRYLRA